MSMDAKRKYLTEIMNSFDQFIGTLNRLENLPVSLETGDTLYRSEIHLISMIGANPDIHLSELARRLGVTRGAVSQLATRLEKKGLARRKRVPGSDREIILELTKRGTGVLSWHQRFHQQINEAFQGYFLQYDSEQLAFIKDVVKHLNQQFNLYIPDNEIVIPDKD